MEHEKIERINELTRLSRERELTHEELVEREALRRRYEERYDLYCAAADLHIDGDGTVEETAPRIEKEWMK